MGHLARAFYGFEHMVTTLINNPASVPACDATFGTFPCQNVTELKFENGYGTTKTAHLFTDTQRIFFNKYKSPIVCNEMVMPTPRNGHGYNHAGVIRRGDAQLNILFSFLTEMQIGPFIIY